MQLVDFNTLCKILGGQIRCMNDYVRCASGVWVLRNDLAQN